MHRDARLHQKFHDADGESISRTFTYSRIAIMQEKVKTTKTTGELKQNAGLVDEIMVNKPVPIGGPPPEQ